MRRRLVVVGVVAMIAALVPSTALATGGEGETWPAFTESSSCGAQRITTAHAPEPGGLPSSFILRGQYADFFGRTVQDVRDAFVRWDVPGSSETLITHPFALPALETVAENLRESIDAGQTYEIDERSTFAASSRTIRSSIRISRHTYGIALDFNAPRNPYRGDNRLVTDMPAWWVDGFLDAGYCWGGLWIGSKDAMHFAWQGPAFSGYTSIPEPYAPLTDPRPYDGAPDASVRVVPRSLGDPVATMLTDVDTNGAADVVHVIVDGSDVIVDASVASRRHNACSSRRSIVPELGDRARNARAVGFGDWDGRGGNDLWVVEDDGGTARLTVRWAFGGYTAETTTRTAVPTPSETAWVTTADVDVDGNLDLLSIDGGRLRAWSVDPDTGSTDLLLDAPDPYPGASHRFLGDTDVDNRPDLMAIVDGTVAVATGASGYEPSGERQRPLGLPSDPIDVVGSDYDGDGRVDLVTFDGFWKRVWLGNTPLPDDQALETWFEFSEPECGDGERTWERDELRFSSSGWVARGSHGWRSLHGLPTGCDPEDPACRIGPLTRTDVFEFLAWIDGLPPGATDPDRAAARALETAGYRLPCASADDACLDGLVPRPELSAYFGVFLADRHGGVPAPHRWVYTTPPVVPDDPRPR